MDLKATTTKALASSCQVFLKDLQALPEDAFDKKFGPNTRTVADIVYEVNLVNEHVRMTICGEEPFEWPDEGWIKAPEDFRKKDAVVAAFELTTQKLINSVEAFTIEQLEGKVTTERGETDRYERCRFITLHMWYHGGQLNFIQTLLGDTAWHW